MKTDDTTVDIDDVIDGVFCVAVVCCTVGIGLAVCVVEPTVEVLATKLSNDDEKESIIIDGIGDAVVALLDTVDVDDVTELIEGVIMNDEMAFPA